MNIDYPRKMMRTSIKEQRNEMIKQSKQQLEQNKAELKQKQQIQMICKRLKHYCNSNYNLNGTDYKDINEVYVDAKYIEAYGDIPTVRKVCHKLNNCFNKPCILKPKISDIVKKELEKKQLYKSSKIIKCTVRHGHFTINFD